MSKLATFMDQVKTKYSKDNPDIIFDPKRRIEAISSGDVMFDLISGVGGFPRARLTEVFGMEHSGKTSLCLASAAQVQRKKGVAVLYDYESAWDPVFAYETYGLVQDPDTFIVVSPDTIEEGAEIFDLMCKTVGAKLDLCIFDSIAAMKPRDLIEGNLDDPQKVASQARAVARMITKVRIYAKHSKCAAVFTNQMYTNIKTGYPTDQNTGTGAGYNPNEQYTTYGGASPRFYSSLRMKLEYGTKIEDISGEDQITGKEGKVRIGNEIKIINVKNKVATPFLKGSTYFYFPNPAVGERGGWREAKTLLEILRLRGRVSQASTKFTYKGHKYPEWVNVGSKAESEEKWMNTPEFVEDAKVLVALLMDKKSETLLERARLEEIEQDMQGQEDEVPEESEVPDDGKVKEVTL